MKLLMLYKVAKESNKRRLGVGPFFLAGACDVFTVSINRVKGILSLQNLKHLVSKMIFYKQSNFLVTFFLFFSYVLISV